MAQVHPPDHRNYAPHYPTNSKVLGIMDKFRDCLSTDDQQSYIASLLLPGTAACSAVTVIAGRVEEGDRDDRDGLTAEEEPADVVSIAKVAAGGLTPSCGWGRGRGRGQERGQGMHVSPLVSGMGRGGAGGKGGEISESNATVELPTVGDVGGWEGASWRPRGRGHFLSCAFNALDKESSIGPDTEGPLRVGVGG